MTGEHAVTVALAMLVVLGVMAQWLGRRLGFASLLLLLPAGVLAGSSGLVDPRRLFGDALFPLTTMLVALLLFHSGLKLRLDDLPGEARRPVRRLVVIGAVITFAGSTAGALVIVGLDANLAFLIGAILIVSGPTVVNPLLEVLRARHRTAVVLQWEGVILDPIGATVGVVVLNMVLAAGRGGVHPVLQMAARVGIGVAVGLLAAVLLAFVMSRFLVTDNMEVAVAVALALAAFTSAEVLLSEAGLIAALTLGVATANQRVAPTARIVGFGETLEVLIIGVLFVLLGALVDLDDLAAIAGRALVFVALLVLVVRPLAVAAALAGSSLPWRDRVMIGCMNPRGIVAAATAAQFSGSLSAAGVDADLVTPVTFAVILGTGVVYSVAAPIVARALGVSDPAPAGVAVMGHDAWVHDLACALHELGASVLLVTSRPTVDREDGTGVQVVPIHESEAALDWVLDDAAIGQALVASESTVVGTLVVADLVELLGRRNVYRLPTGAGTEPRLHTDRWNPQPFGPGITLAEIDARTRAGATVQIVHDGPPAGALVLAVVREDRSVDLAPATRSRARRPRGAGIGPHIALVPPMTADRIAEADGFEPPIGSDPKPD